MKTQTLKALVLLVSLYSCGGARLFGQNSMHNNHSGNGNQQHQKSSNHSKTSNLRPAHIPQKLYVNVVQQQLASNLQNGHQNQQNGKIKGSYVYPRRLHPNNLHNRKLNRRQHLKSNKPHSTNKPPYTYIVKHEPGPNVQDQGYNKKGWKELDDSRFYDWYILYLIEKITDHRRQLSIYKKSKFSHSPPIDKSEAIKERNRAIEENMEAIKEIMDGENWIELKNKTKAEED